MRLHIHLNPNQDGFHVKYIRNGAIPLISSSEANAIHPLIGRIFSANSCETALKALIELNRIVELVDTEPRVFFPSHLHHFYRVKDTEAQNNVEILLWFPESNYSSRDFLIQTRHINVLKKMISDLSVLHSLNRLSALVCQPPQPQGHEKAALSHKVKSAQSPMQDSDAVIDYIDEIHPYL